jgi:hypothetical protein
MEGIEVPGGGAVVVEALNAAHSDAEALDATHGVAEALNAAPS